MRIFGRQLTALFAWRVIAATLVVFALHYSGIIAPLENVLVRTIAPAQHWLFSIAQRQQDAAQEEHETADLSREDLIARITELEESNQNLTLENAYLQTVVEETTLLEEQVNFLKQRKLNGISARVTSRTTDTLSQTIMIDAGTVAGIQVGNPVIIDNGVLVGTVVDVSEYSAQVLLITSPDSQVSAAVRNEQSSPGIVSGSLNVSLQMDFIPQLDDVVTEQAVFTSGVEDRVPANLLVGTIEEVIDEPGSVFQQAYVDPVFRATELSIVTVVLP